jgi:hypothetical protein
MFVYSHTVFRGVRLWAFRVSDNAMYAVAQFVQDGILDREHVEIHPFSNTITVYVLNSRMFKFSYDECYLSLIDCIAKGYLDIDMMTKKDRFVPSWYRYYIEDITDETWLTIYKNKLPPEQIDDYIYYGDNTYDEDLYDEYDITIDEIENQEYLYSIDVLTDSYYEDQEYPYPYEQPVLKIKYDPDLLTKSMTSK